MKPKKLINFLFFIANFQLFGQVVIPGYYLQNFDKFNDTTHLTLYPSIATHAIQERVEFVAPLFRTSYNSKYPRSLNDGAVWKGKGITSELHVGISGRIKKLSYVIVPSFFFSQNLGFALVGSDDPYRNEFNYQFNHNIDWVQRYGSKSFINLNFGQSEINYNFGEVSLAISSQNYSLGPSLFNPILLSINAGGFPHFRTSYVNDKLKLGKTALGRVQASMIHGILKGSDYIEESIIGDYRIFSGLFLAYSPSFLDQLTLGFNRIHYKSIDYFKAVDLFSPIIIFDDGSLPDGGQVPNDAFDGIASVTIEWKFPEVGFRTYLEYARNDFAGGLEWNLLEPDGGQRAYSLGFEKIFLLESGREFVIQYEHTNLARGAVLLYRNADQSYYTHYVNRYGYTNNGQILGAGIGPGSSSDNFGLKLNSAKYSVGFLIQRIEANRDYFNKNIQDVNFHDQEYTLLASNILKRSRLEYLFEFGLSHNFNRYYKADQTNIYASAGISIKVN